MGIWDYLKKYHKIREEHPENLETFVQSAGSELVSLHNVAMALDDLSEDIGVMMGKLVEVQEERFRDIVTELPEELQLKIKQKFMVNEDDLFVEGE